MRIVLVSKLVIVCFVRNRISQQHLQKIDPLTFSLIATRSMTKIFQKLLEHELWYSQVILPKRETFLEVKRFINLRIFDTVECVCHNENRSPVETP